MLCVAAVCCASFAFAQSSKSPKPSAQQGASFPNGTPAFGSALPRVIPASVGPTLPNGVFPVSERAFELKPAQLGPSFPAGQFPDLPIAIGLVLTPVKPGPTATNGVPMFVSILPIPPNVASGATFGDGVFPDFGP